MRFLKNFSILLMGLVVCTITVSGQRVSDLENAFRQSSDSLLREFMQSFATSDQVMPASDTTRKVNKLLSRFLRSYCSDPTAVNSGAYKLPKGKQQQYIVLQPQVEICFTSRDELDSVLTPYHEGTRESFDMPLYRHMNVYRDFPSGSYYMFKNLSTCRLQSYSLEINAKKNYLPIIADTLLVHLVNGFLHEEDTDYTKKIKFLTPFLALYPGAQVQARTKRGDLQMSFGFSLYIDKIVMDYDMEAALIQYAFIGGSLEAFYRFKENEWEGVKNGYVMRF